jgi:predicted dehydrogenase
MASNIDPVESPSAKAMDQAIDRAIEGTSSYPKHTAFVNADSPHAGQEITNALDAGYAIALISGDGHEQIIFGKTPAANLDADPAGERSSRLAGEQPLGVALVGYGYWGPNLARNVSQCAEFSLEALCDLDPANLKLFSRDYPASRAVRDLDAVLSDPNIDAVVIATPPRTHFEIARQALEADKHVLVETPLAMHIGEAHELAKIASSAKRVLMPGHTFVYSPAVNTVRNLIRDGVIGDVHFVTSSRLNLGKYNDDGVLWDLAPSDLSILLHWLGQPVIEVAASGSSVLRQGIPETAFMTLTFEQGQTANVQVSWLAPRKVRQMIVVGSQRMVQYDDTASDEPVRIYDRGMDMLPPKPADFGEHQLIYRTGDVLIPRVEPKEPLRLELEDFAHAIRTGEEPHSSLALGIEIVSVLELANESMRQGGATQTVVGRETSSTHTAAA